MEQRAKTSKPPLTIQIQFACGCGFTTDVLRAAEEHAFLHDHSLTVTGMIRSPHREVNRQPREQKIEREFKY
jgi:hypothetical protein